MSEAVISRSILLYRTAREADWNGCCAYPYSGERLQHMKHAEMHQKGQDASFCLKGLMFALAHCWQSMALDWQVVIRTSIDG